MWPVGSNIGKYSLATDGNNLYMGTDEDKLEVVGLASVRCSKSSKYSVPISVRRHSKEH
jgi:hypothetical protein